jgi:hypothetical protein
MGRLLALPLSALLLSCNEPQVAPHVDLPKDQIWTSQHFRYAARAGDPEVCSGVVDQLEAHLQALTTYLGLAWTGGVIGYYKFRDLEDYQSNSGCPKTSGGCETTVPDVRSPWTLHGHELIHIYMRPLGRPPDLFEEGVAEALSPEGRTFPPPSENWRDILARPPAESSVTLKSSYYMRSAWFVTYLLRNFGPTPFVAFYRAAASDHAAVAIAENFQKIYGLKLDDVWNQALASAPSLTGVPVWECASAEPIVMGGPDTSLTDRCDGHRHFAGLELTGPTTFTWSDTSTTGFDILSCSSDLGLYAQLPMANTICGAVALPAGRYYVTPNDSQGNVGFRQASGVLGSDCNSLSPFVLRTADGLNTLKVVIANSPVPWFVKPQIPGQASFSMRNASYPGSDTAATVEVCDTCQGPCRIIKLTYESEVSDGMVLRFTNLDGPDGASLTRMGYSW